MFFGIASAATFDGSFTFTVTYETLVKIVAGVVAAILIWALGKLWPYLRDHFKAVWRLRKAERAFSIESPGVWISKSFPPRPAKEISDKIRRSKPIITVANLKGGVGKTTTVANLLGHYSRAKGKKVLAIDLDFQGSLTRVLLQEADRNRLFEEQAYGSDCKAASLVAGKDAQWLLHVAETVHNAPSARCIPSYYTLSNMENRVLFEWLISKRKEDVRYSLAKILLDQQVQDSFDIILIDAPPRLTTACIQALCASTHVLVPTVLDGLSAEASGSFVDQLVTNQSLWPQLRLLGVFGNMTERMTVHLETSQQIDLLDYEQDSEIAARDAVKHALLPAFPVLRSSQDCPLLPNSCFIPDKRELGRRAGEGIAYLPSGGTRPVQELSRAFDRLGDEIDRRIAATKLG